ncbi:MAG: DEAD/DEAH box helicase [Bacteroidales bacterium]|nr:DEAD/DEAH box helicase [Bacteroidales bacterium]
MNFGEKISNEILNSSEFNELFLKAVEIYTVELLGKSTNTYFTHNDLNKYCRFADVLSNVSSPFSRNKAYHLISLLFFKYKEERVFKETAFAVLSKLGLFAVCDNIDFFSQPIILPFDRTVENETKRTIQRINGSDKLFTDKQYQLFSEIINANYYSFSAPTSMGKSFLIKRFIEDSISSTNKPNIVVIVPTRALINQFSIELKDELSHQFEENNYKIFTNSNVSKNLIADSITKYLFILTPERLLSYLSIQENPQIDLLFVDEAHKLGANDERSITEYTAIDTALYKFPNLKIYFASPIIANPGTFLELFEKNAKFSFETQESPVAHNLYYIDYVEKKFEYHIDKYSKILNNNFFDTNQTIENAIFNIGKNFDSNLIYCGSRAETLKNAKYFFDNLILEEIDIPEVNSAIRKIKVYIHNDYYPAKFLKKGIAFHHGRLPQIVRNIIEDLYRNKHIKFIFCTSTLLEGINMPTRNIFIMPDSKFKFLQNESNKSIENSNRKINFWNLAGRAGRYTKELSGNIFCFNSLEKKWENKDLFVKESINLSITIEDRINRRVEKIERMLENGPINHNEEERIIEFVVNILRIDKRKYVDQLDKSRLLKQFIEKNQNKIIELVNSKANELTEIPLSVLCANQSLNLKIQSDLYFKIKQNPNLHLLPTPDYDNILEILKKFFDYYNWPLYEKEFVSDKPDENGKIDEKKKLKRMQYLMNKWINGVPLNLIIEKSIDDHVAKRRKIRINYSEYVLFDRTNDFHINVLINDTIEYIEKVLRFKLEKYFNHYHQVLLSFIDETSVGMSWATYLEYGTKIPEVIAIQNYGLSRHTANTIFKNHRHCLLIDGNGTLTEINKSKLLREIDSNTVEYDEIEKIL